MKFKLIIMFIIIYSFSPKLLNFYPERNKYTEKYSWMGEKLYNLYKARSLEFGVSMRLATCLVQTESHGKIVVSKKNENGTRDYGRFQVNSVHKPVNTRELLWDRTNSRYGFSYLSKCIRKDHLPDAIRLYNQGLNGKRKNYKNWKYVGKILGCYIQDIIKDKV